MENEKKNSFGLLITRKPSRNTSFLTLADSVPFLIGFQNVGKNISEAKLVSWSIYISNETFVTLISHLLYVDFLALVFRDKSEKWKYKCVSLHLACASVCMLRL